MVKSLSLKSNVQLLILKKCLEVKGKFIPLTDLISEVERIVRYRASAALSLNSKALESRGIIERKIVNRKVYVRLKPESVVLARRLLNIRVPYELISGYTWNPLKPEDLMPIKNYIDAINKLEREGIKPSKIICFTTPEASRKRLELNVKPEPDVEVKFEFKVYQSNINLIEEELGRIVENEIWDYNIILDITPLTKLYTIAAINIARKYDLKMIYHFGDQLIWLEV